MQQLGAKHEMGAQISNGGADLICTRRTASHQLSDNNNRSSAHWADHQWRAEWLDNITRLRTFIPNTGTHHPGMTLPRRDWVRLNRPRNDVGRFAPVCPNGVWLPLWPVSVAQKNKPSTTLSSNVQSIDHPMDCTA